MTSPVVGSQTSSSSRAAAFVADQQPLVPGDGGELQRGEAAAGPVVQLGDGVTGGDVEHPQRGVAGVAVSEWEMASSVSSSDSAPTPAYSVCR